MKNNNRIVYAAAVLGMSFAVLSCQNKSKTNPGKSSLLSMDTTPKGDIPNGNDPASLCQYLKDNNYYLNSYPQGTKVLFSSSYEVVNDSAGQGYGMIGADGMFEQQGNTTTQLLLCPGAQSISGGKCAWRFNGKDGYAQLALDVVCNSMTRKGGSVHSGYNSQSAKIVSYVAQTAGQSVSGQEAVEVILSSNTSKARIVFAKGVGLVATVFQESTSPSGTAEVFIGGNGGGSLGLTK